MSILDVEGEGFEAPAKSTLRLFLDGMSSDQTIICVMLITKQIKDYLHLGSPHVSLKDQCSK